MRRLDNDDRSIACVGVQFEVGNAVTVCGMTGTIGWEGVCVVFVDDTGDGNDGGNVDVAFCCFIAAIMALVMDVCRLLS